MDNLFKKYWKLLLYCALLCAGVIYFGAVWQAGHKLLKAFRPIFIAVFFALVFDSPVRFLEHKVFKFKRTKWRRPVAITVTYVLTAALLALMLYLFVPQFAESLKGFVSNLPEYLEKSKIKASEILLRAGVGENAQEKLFYNVAEAVKQLSGKISEQLPQAVQGVKNMTATITDLLFALVLSIYILADKKRILQQFCKFINSIMPLKVSVWLKNTATIAGAVFSQFLSGQLLEALLLGVMTFIGMLLLSLPYPALVSMIVMVSNIIPMLGAYIGGAAGFVIISFVSVEKAVVYLIFMILLQQFENNVTYPRVVGNSLGLRGFWIMSAVIIGGALFGFWGIMLGVPAVAVVYKLIGRAVAARPWPCGLFLPALKKPAQHTSDDRA